MVDDMDIFDELAQLAANWDGYNALPIHPEALRRAKLLMTILATTPAVSPLNNGTVQLEWHHDGYDVEIEVGATRAVIDIYLSRG